MTTVYSIVNAALRKSNCIDAQESPTAADMASCIDALNRMMRRWEADGLAMGWNDIANPTDTLPAPPEAENAIIYNLSLDVTPEYGNPVSQIVAQMASSELRKLQSDMMVYNPLRARSRLPEPDRSWGNYNVYTDSSRC